MQPIILVSARQRVSSSVAVTARWVRLVPMLAALLCGCGHDEGEPADTKEAVDNTAWGDNVTITFGDGSFRFRSNGLPNHALQAEYVMPDDFTPCVPHPTTACSHIEPTAQAVGEVAPDLRIAARGIDGVIEAVEHRDPGTWVMGVQWHPEDSDGPAASRVALFTALLEQATVYRYNRGAF